MHGDHRVGEETRYESARLIFCKSPKILDQLPKNWKGRFGEYRVVGGWLSENIAYGCSGMLKKSDSPKRAGTLSERLTTSGASEVFDDSQYASQG